MIFDTKATKKEDGTWVIECNELTAFALANGAAFMLAGFVQDTQFGVRAMQNLLAKAGAYTPNVLQEAVLSLAVVGAGTESAKYDAGVEALAAIREELNAAPTAPEAAGVA
jgi:TPP-dependent 2-oxoacid decarboxylase